MATVVISPPDPHGLRVHIVAWPLGELDLGAKPIARWAPRPGSVAFCVWASHDDTKGKPAIELWHSLSSWGEWLQGVLDTGGAELKVPGVLRAEVKVWISADGLADVITEAKALRRW